MASWFGISLLSMVELHCIAFMGVFHKINISALCQKGKGMVTATTMILTLFSIAFGLCF
jgi:hypothetical protein